MRADVAGAAADEDLHGRHPRRARGRQRHLPHSRHAHRLITGITGQDGLYLAELLLAKGYDVHGVIRGQNNPRRELVERLVPGRAPAQRRPDRHVQPDAGPARLRARRGLQPRRDQLRGLLVGERVVTSDVTGEGVLTMLEAVRLHAGDDPSAVRFYQASSSEMFGKVQEVPQRERTLLWPRSPYGVSKVYGHYMTINYRESYGMHASSGILFNHESPRRGQEFVTRKMSQAVAPSTWAQDELVLGNLDARRDWGFAGDYVEAMWLMLQQPERRRLRHRHRARPTPSASSVHVAFATSASTTGSRYVRQDPRFMRPAEVDQLIGDATKARAVLGWEPTGQLRASSSR